MTVADLFEELKTKQIVCWGSGKHFRNTTYPFLIESGLIENLTGFVDIPGSQEVVLEGVTYPKIMKQELSQMDASRTLILITAVGYQEILAQIQADAELTEFDAIPSIFVESLFEDMRMLAVDKPPLQYRKHADRKIPKVIHTFWFSGEEMPDRYQRCLASWRQYAIDYEIKIWDLNTYHPENCEFFDQAIEKKYWAFAADYARADVLRKLGGVYMDLDVEMLRPIDDLLYNDAYMSFESLDRIECGSGIGAVAGNRILEEICEDYESRPFIKPDGSLDLSTCPVRFTKVIEQHGLVKNGGFQVVDDITIYPFEVLTGKSFDTGLIYRTEHSYTTHHHNGSWVPDPAQRAMDDRYAEIQRFIQTRGVEIDGIAHL